MGLGNVINDAVGAVTGSGRGTTLDDFLTKFSPMGGATVNTIDTLHTFDVYFEFFPNPASDTKKTAGEAMVESLTNSAIGAANNAMNAVTGGLAGSIANGLKKSIEDSHDGFSDITSGKKSFVNYLAESMLLINADNVISKLNSSTVILNLGLYIQAMSLPQMKQIDNGKVDTMLGSFPLNGSSVVPESNTFTMTVLNTRLPLLEILFYPWMREATLPYWSYDNQPYTTANVTVDFTKHAEVKYNFYGVRPSQIQTYEPTQEPDTTITRDVVFMFDFMMIDSPLKTTESWSDKLLGTAGNLAGAAANMMNV